MRASILLVDDEEEMTEFVRDALEDEGYAVRAAYNVEQAERLILERLPDLIVLDVMMPGTDGFQFCKQVRDSVDCPIIFVSARESEADRIYGLAAGGDDYIVKPFSLRELKARIEAHLRRERRSIQRRDSGLLKFGSYTIDVRGYELRCQGQTLPLTNREFAIVELLALHPGQVFAREHIYEQVWGMDAFGDDATVTEHIKNIRAKMAAADPDSRWIETVWGVGYKWGGRS
ncbi:response regulator transcription factor [Paenibacillus sp. MER TA 81-3]|uniref:response regulator transcription factor n=1 Tax=Paenibacillus sp. MER TA 81-3 TaxID=2939573 RepID=UPI00203F2181|nr:response regulator transcription factor [Paenibacillus sp. MER TA 81-3]MCM3339202.1 response regulator transcription factor [Paenibacillus sp. MER TA 81-3]